MRIIARRTLLEFVESRKAGKDHAALKSAVNNWFAEVSKASWSNMAEVKSLYATASVVSAEQIVFNIKGNDYRLVVSVHFPKATVFVKWIGTHRDYDRINVKEVQYRG